MATSFPFGMKGSETYLNLRTMGMAGAQFINETVRIPLWNLNNVRNATGPADVVSYGAGNALLTAIGSSTCAGFLLNASTEAYGNMWLVPNELDVSGDIRVRYFGSESGTGGSGSALMAATYTPLTTGTTAVAIGATALDTVITALTPSTTANALQATAWGTLDGATLTITPGDDVLTWNSIVTLTTITDFSVYEMQLEYKRKFVG
jgi:hypothetical protein